MTFSCKMSFLYLTKNTNNFLMLSNIQSIFKWAKLSQKINLEFQFFLDSNQAYSMVFDCYLKSLSLSLLIQNSPNFIFIFSAVNLFKKQGYLSYKIPHTPDLADGFFIISFNVSFLPIFPLHQKLDAKAPFRFNFSLYFFKRMNKKNFIRGASNS